MKVGTCLVCLSVDYYRGTSQMIYTRLRIFQKYFVALVNVGPARYMLEAIRKFNFKH